MAVVPGSEDYLRLHPWWLHVAFLVANVAPWVAVMGDLKLLLAVDFLVWL